MIPVALQLAFVARVFVAFTIIAAFVLMAKIVIDVIMVLQQKLIFFRFPVHQTNPMLWSSQSFAVLHLILHSL